MLLCVKWMSSGDKKVTVPFRQSLSFGIGRLQTGRGGVTVTDPLPLAFPSGVNGGRGLQEAIPSLGVGGALGIGAGGPADSALTGGGGAFTRGSAFMRKGSFGLWEGALAGARLADLGCVSFAKLGKSGGGRFGCFCNSRPCLGV